MKSAAEKLRRLRLQISQIQKRAEGSSPGVDDRAPVIRRGFRKQMDRDLEVRGALDPLFRILEAVRPDDLTPAAAASLIAVLRETDQVLNVIF